MPEVRLDVESYVEREAKRLLLCVPCETTVARKEICHAQARSIKN